MLNPVALLLWRNLGPYHLARGRAVAELCEPHGVRTVLVQIAAREDTRDWRDDPLPEGIDVRTLAPEARLSDDMPSRGRELRGLLEELRPSVVAVAGYDRPEMRSALTWGASQGARVVLMSETKLDDRARRPWWRRELLRRLVARAGAGLVSGGASTEYLVSLGIPRERVFRPYGVVDNTLFERAARASAPDEKSAPYFFACARLIEERKNMLGLLEAYELYRRRAGERPWELVICGDGADRDRYARYVARRGLQGVTLAGFQQAEDLATYYARASCFVHPAVKEAWGLVVNEAMAAGLPVLVSRRCGCAVDLVVEGVNGYTFDPSSAQELSGLMVRMTELESETRLRMGRAGQERIRSWSPQAFAGGLLAAARAAGSSALPFDVDAVATLGVEPC